MKKSCSIIFLFIAMLFIQNSVVNAEKYTCGYYAEGDLGWQIHLDYEVDGDSFTLKNREVHAVETVLDFFVTDTYNQYSSWDEKKKALINFLDGRCQKTVTVCEGKYQRYGVLLDNQFELEAHNYEGYPANDVAGAADSGLVEKTALWGGNNNCFTMSIYEPTTTGKIVDSISDTCEKFDEYFGENGDKNLKDLYNKCNKDSEKDACTKYNSYKNEIQSYCSLTVQYGNYNNACVRSCVNNLNEEIYNIEQITSSGDCNVSNRIINWIANIMKWMKYIAPVLVIILSMVDFIKAIASNSDEEVKKTQGKFVKRLIAAALLFIIPFIIQFALETFKLTTDYCGLI